MELNKLIERINSALIEYKHRHFVLANGDLLIKFLLNTALKGRLNGELIPVVKPQGAVGLQNIKSNKVLVIMTEKDRKQIYFNGEFHECNQVEFDNCLLDLIFLV